MNPHVIASLQINPVEGEGPCHWSGRLRAVRHADCGFPLQFEPSLIEVFNLDPSFTSSNHARLVSWAGSPISLPAHSRDTQPISMCSERAHKQRRCKDGQIEQTKQNETEEQINETLFKRRKLCFTTGQQKDQCISSFAIIHCCVLLLCKIHHSHARVSSQWRVRGATCEG